MAITTLRLLFNPLGHPVSAWLSLPFPPGGVAGMADQRGLAALPKTPYLALLPLLQDLAGLLLFAALPAFKSKLHKNRDFVLFMVPSLAPTTVSGTEDGLNKSLLNKSCVEALPSGKGAGQIHVTTIGRGNISH